MRRTALLALVLIVQCLLPESARATTGQPITVAWLTSSSHAASFDAGCRLIFSPATSQRCFTPRQVSAAEHHLPRPPLNPSTGIFAVTGLSLTQVIDTIGLGYAGTTPAGRVPAINYLFGKVPAVHGYLRLAHRPDGSIVWQRPHFVIVREVVGRYASASIQTAKFTCLFSVQLSARVAMAMDQTISGCGLSYFVTYLPRQHLSLFVSTNLGPGVARQAGEIILTMAHGGK